MQIDILVRICDNLGDMGFAYELAFSLQRVMDQKGHFRFFTDEVSTLEHFFALQWVFFEVYDQDDWALHTHSDTAIFVVLFRGDFTQEMLSLLPMGTPTLWIDYLTFDPSIASLSTQEHILSSREYPVYHLVNSPLSGLLPAHSSLSESSGEERIAALCEIIGTEYCSADVFQLVFSYQAYDIMRLIDAPHVLNIWLGPVTQAEIFDQSGLMIPYVPIDRFYRLFVCVDAMIVRGEVSLVSALHSGTPFYWDMYKALGGWNEHEHRCFLEWMRPSFEALEAHMLFDRYAQTSHRLNQSYQLTWDDMEQLRSHEMRRVFADIRSRAARSSLTQRILSYLA